MARKNPETAVVSGFSEPISFSVRNVGCGRWIRTIDLRVMRASRDTRPVKDIEAKTGIECHSRRPLADQVTDADISKDGCAFRRLYLEKRWQEKCA